MPTPGQDHLDITGVRRGLSGAEALLLGRRVWGRVCFRRWGRRWSDLGMQGAGVEGDCLGERLGQVEGDVGGVGVGAVQVEDDAFRVGQVGERAEATMTRCLQWRESVAQAGLGGGEHQPVVVAGRVEYRGQGVFVDDRAVAGHYVPGFERRRSSPGTGAREHRFNGGTDDGGSIQPACDFLEFADVAVSAPAHRVDDAAGDVGLGDGFSRGCFESLGAEGEGLWQACQSLLQARVLRSTHVSNGTPLAGLGVDLIHPDAG
ncbi:hypothetical protein STRTUCAR8_07674 [Streptomyces turgidiscabies Car8]|uniref:Uncharacterized protein n=1 Tax=Streptomyces turgidiscabies (strain Car8) TaxID=698760 RepID=L7ESW6_STRT8|nr:hypothetical protein STRTUCAR8_07674 [Streptomyces turgidiscabies Car8]GAQ74168.1 hypothetical protein T45_05940 [Streptomyces turgidiscabies]